MVDAIDDGLEDPGFGSTAAVVLVACAALSLVILPAATALQAPGVQAAWVTGALGTLAAVIALGKLAATAWFAALRLWGLHRASVSAAYAD